MTGHEQGTRPRLSVPLRVARLFTVAAGLGLTAALIAGASSTGRVTDVPTPNPPLPPNAPAPAALLLAAPSSSSSPAPPPGDAGNPTATITAPTDGSSYPAGTAISLTATFSTDLRTALAAGTNRSCYFNLGDDANSTTVGTINISAGTCTASWTYSYGAAYTVTAAITTPSLTTYGTLPITLTVSGGTNPRCTGGPGAPSGCVYRWTETYYDASNTRHARVCTIDGGCQWQTSHTSWRQIPGSDYWITSTGNPLPDGNLAEAYLCIGSTAANWSSYASNHNLDTLLSRPDTSASPVPAGTC